MCVSVCGPGPGTPAETLWASALPGSSVSEMVIHTRKTSSSLVCTVTDSRGHCSPGIWDSVERGQAVRRKTQAFLHPKFSSPLDLEFSGI